MFPVDVRGESAVRERITAGINTGAMIIERDANAAPPKGGALRNFLYVSGLCEKPEAAAVSAIAKRVAGAAALSRADLDSKAPSITELLQSGVTLDDLFAANATPDDFTAVGLTHGHLLEMGLEDKPREYDAATLRAPVGSGGEDPRVLKLIV